MSEQRFIRTAVGGTPRPYGHPARSGECFIFKRIKIFKRKECELFPASSGVPNLDGEAGCAEGAMKCAAVGGAFMSAIMQILLILLIGVQTIFADTLYLKDGSEIKDAKIVKIGVSEVEYKIGKKDVLYTAKKSDIAMIFYADGTREVFKDDGTSQSGDKQPIIINNNQNQNVNQNVAVDVGTQSVTKEPVYRCGFTSGERWGTWFMNIIPGLGSITVMDDWNGAIMQWSLIGGLTVGGAVLSFLIEDKILINPTIGIGAGIVYSSYRSYSYCKPGSVACGSNGGFNISVMPTRHGSLLPAVTYSRGF